MISPDEKWFKSAGTKDPKLAARVWSDWLVEAKGGRSDGAKCRKALELATGKSRSAIGFYFARPHELSETTRANLNRLVASLEFSLPPEPTFPSRAASRAARVVILTGIANVPSPRFHLDAFAACARALSAKGVVCALHEIVENDMEGGVTKVAINYRPAGAIFLRITPTARTEEILKQHNIPAVLIHAHDRKHGYGPPILANLVPDFSSLTEGLKIWARALPKSRDPIVFVRMRAESIDSIRQRRIEAVMHGLQESRIKEHIVCDYSFRHAFAVVRAFPKVRAYVCLSDEVAVGIKKILEAKGENWDGRIIGYDDSRLARHEGIMSFGQSIVTTANRAIELLTNRISRHRGMRDEWPKANTETIPVTWTSGIAAPISPSVTTRR